MECAFTSPVRTECGMFVMYCMQCGRGCGVSRRYIDVCYCDMFISFWVQYVCVCIPVVN